MVSRGVHQLKNMRLYFCDFGGSSLGVRDFLKSPQLVDFVSKNEHLNLEIFLRRGHHPYVSSTYVNGYVKDQPLRGMEEDHVLQEFQKFNNSFGRQALKHNSIKVTTSRRSVQGGWEDNMWENYPVHQMEVIKDIPFSMIPEPIPQEIRFKTKKYNYLTTHLRKRFRTHPMNRNA